jgi:hypothetical protein
MFMSQLISTIPLQSHYYCRKVAYNAVFVHSLQVLGIEYLPFSSYLHVLCVQQMVMLPKKLIVASSVYWHCCFRRHCCIIIAVNNPLSLLRKELSYESLVEEVRRGLDNFVLIETFQNIRVCATSIEVLPINNVHIKLHESLIHTIWRYMG